MSDESKNAGQDKRHHEGDVAFIQALAELLDRNELTELTVKREYDENDRLTVSLSKHQKQAAPQAAPAAFAAPAAMAPAAAPAPAPAAAPASEDPASLPGVVTSPMVGTAYLAPEPGATPFVAIGQQVKEGETLMIVEAMKTMNHIPSPRSGTVKRILVDDGSPVEFGAPLMVVE
ncbi:acetyl-CoA carboxylase biotin carboxyl carrier protein [Paracoccus sp. P2]|uniref:Biotin carboxyl carrier protein of acetyl-CoA carboxylase n=2 Tax=Paracoccus pantotrophus TaxID=82367 RepID=A0A7H9BRR4_PARPN|nr:acetyl-CoA carboxylase biotin carboxyl carrier protein [Paracoccus pantotrophus]MDF3854264.1 acetyl-CoA carboxylase biotin carboxyl carrier protein [Paracoccus pantotrophus]QLH13676.1 acetyl-CoA carboxylase biotin carboxyl carrier protein [Paracoccus pantotrophus]RNI17676.1 acetyl-CoA carboxylase biotin carboxyl carrier protein [Paracoccus pantotrophus]WGR67161.1 acetyl-CoA carboxylase biotin carboxyl carrier protein [Paracoccus pantotrophus]SFO29750.1 acetyl-CoA carboxylase biotin carboxyl